MWPGSLARPPGAAPLLPQTRSGRGRPQTRLQRDREHHPVSAKALALSLPKEAWQTVAWREGSAERLSSRFARQRVRSAHRDTELSQPRRGVAADRVAGKRKRADEVLVRH